MFRSFFYGLQNSWKWRKVIWEDDPGDQSFLFYILEFKLREMSKFFATQGHHVGDSRISRQTLTAAILCGRLANEAYTNGLWGTVVGERARVVIGKHSYKSLLTYEDYMMEQDLELLTKILRKHVRCWWD